MQVTCTINDEEIMEYQPYIKNHPTIMLSMYFDDILGTVTLVPLNPFIRCYATCSISNKVTRNSRLISRHRFYLHNGGLIIVYFHVFHTKGSCSKTTSSEF